MKLPHADAVEIAKEKITDYLLNPLHPDAAGKAAFFRAMGFTVEDWGKLGDALRDVALTCPVAETVESAHGTKYVVIGAIATPIGKRPLVRTIWIIDQGESLPRLVTAYPHEEGVADVERT